jgi:hypothetical protein
MISQTYRSFLPLAVAFAFLLCLVQAVSAQEPRPDPEKMRLGLELGRAGNCEAAFAVFSGLLRRYPGSVDVNFRYAEMAMATGRYAHVVMALERVLLLRPEADRARLDMALALPIAHRKSGTKKTKLFMLTAWRHKTKSSGHWLSLQT